MCIRDRIETLRQTFAQSDENRSAIDQKLVDLIDAIARMNEPQDQTDAVTAAMERVAVGQETLIEVLREHGPGEGMDPESRMRLRSIDVQMLRILEEISAGRQESLAELRKDIDLLVKALARPRNVGRHSRGAGGKE